MGAHTKTRDDVRLILDALRLLVRELRASAAEAERRFGLSGAQLFVLSCLGERKVQSLNELAEMTLTHQSSVSVVVSRLVERGLVKRQESATDARRIELSLTREGSALVRRAPEASQQRLVSGLRRLSPVQRRRLADELLSLLSVLGLREATPALFFEDERHG